MHPWTLPSASSLNPLTITPSCLAFQNAIQTNNVHELKFFTHLYTNSMKSNLVYFKGCYGSNLHQGLPPPLLQPIILQTVLEDTYINDGGFRAKSIMELSETQQEIESILNKGGFQIKSWEHSGENGSSKYLGMTRDCHQNCYLLKFRLNLHKNSWNTCRGRPQFQISPRPFCTYHQEKCPQFYDPTSRSNQSCSSTDVLCTITI